MGQFMNITQGPQVSQIKSIQTGVITVLSGTSSQTATITSVNAAKATVSFDGFRGGETITSGSTSAGAWFPTVEITNATTITATLNTSAGANHIRVRFTVVEYY